MFDPNKPANEQLPYLREVFIRNNKQNVVDMKGEKIFKPVDVTSETYTYTEEERQFYELLTKFILTGKAYASSCLPVKVRVVKLVLVAMQKLASSSIAAIGRAFKNRWQEFKMSAGNWQIPRNAGEKSRILWRRQKTIRTSR